MIIIKPPYKHVETTYLLLKILRCKNTPLHILDRRRCDHGIKSM